MKFFTRYLLILLAIVLITSCGKNSQNTKDLKKYVKELEQRPGKDVEPLPRLNIDEPITTQEQFKRNPYGYHISSDAPNHPVKKRSPERLELFPLDTLNMVGTVYDGKQYWALLQSPIGLFRVKVGEYVGQNNGKIVRITEATVFVSESIPESNGNWSTREVKLDLKGKNEK